MLRFGLVMGLALVALVIPLTAAGPPDAASSRGLLLVTNKGDHTLSIVDPVAGKEISTVPESGVTGHEVIASPDGRTAYVPIYGDSGVGLSGSDGQTLDVIDLASRKRVTTVDFGRPERPHCPKFGPDGMLYVTTELSSDVTVIDPATNKIVARIPTGQPESHMLAITHDGRRGYTANVGPGTVSVLDMAARKQLAVIPISPHTQRISISPDDSMIFTSDQTKPQLAVIHAGSNAVSWVPMPGIGYGTAPTPDGRWLLVALIKINKVGVIDLREMKVARTFDVPAAPQEVLVEPDGKAAYVSCDASRKVAVIELTGAPADWKVAKLIDVGRGADGLAWAALK
jgi:YVTN family beta-propeller protein